VAVGSLGTGIGAREDCRTGSAIPGTVMHWRHRKVFSQGKL